MSRNKPHILAHAALVALAVVFATPLLWMLLTAVKPGDQLNQQLYRLWPDAWRWDNYARAVSAMPYLLHLGNSLLLCIGSVTGTLLSCSLVAYGFSRLRWPGRDLVFGLVIATMLLPWHATMIPRFLLLRELGLYNTLWALILPTFFGEAFYIFLLRQFFLSIPAELSEAARLDGCSELGVYWRIILPLSKPALATVALLQFVAAWNDYGGPLLYLSDPDKFPLSYGLEQFVSAHSTQANLLMAASVLFTLPMVVLFFLTQKTFLRGIATGGVKG